MRNTTLAITLGRFFERAAARAGTVLLVSGIVAHAPPARAAEPDLVAEARATDFFTDRVRPLFVRRCLECHGEETAEGGLRLDSLAGLARGGRSGPAVRPGDVAGSLIVQAVRRLDEAIAMPPEKPLDEGEIAIVSAWIAAGAPHPDGPLPAAAGRAPPARDFWSLKGPAPAAPPAVSPAHGGAVHPIDAFILADLEARGLEPTAVADRATLIRRASFTLTGLPPTPDEIDAFVADPSPDAFATVVDRLLASPRYGEHWGRHWLDVVRYADSNGLD
ncbi:MAG: DUF1549 domain-containing protein, partial [Planctomycetia bacterium]